MTPVSRLAAPSSARAGLRWLAAFALAGAVTAAHAASEIPAPRASATKAAQAALLAQAAKDVQGATPPPAAQTRAGAPAAAEASPDAMERLRLRLAERLAAPGAAAASGTLDLQVGTRALGPAAPRVAPGKAQAPANLAQHGDAPAPASTPSKAAKAPAVPMHRAALGPGTVAAVPAHGVAGSAPRRGAAGGHAVGAGSHTGAHWGYEGAVGPAAWGGLKPDFSGCANGQRQSPIDIRGGLAVDLDPVKFDYRASRFSVIDNGHTVQVNLPPGSAIEVGARRYELVQFHFHRPSEERIDGRQFEMSLHLVHKDALGKLAVVGVLLGKGPAHPAVQTVWNNLPLEKNEEAPARAELNPADLLPPDPRYYTYMGSLTTPPCSEGVLWVVMRTPVTLTAEQIELFARIYPMNARPAQPVAGRRIMQSQ